MRRRPRPLRLWRLVRTARGIAGALLRRRARVLELADGFVKRMRWRCCRTSRCRSREHRRAGRRRTPAQTRVALVLLALWTLAPGRVPDAAAFPPPERLVLQHHALGRRVLHLVDLYSGEPFNSPPTASCPRWCCSRCCRRGAERPAPQTVLSASSIAGDTLARTMRFVVRLTPYGIFALPPPPPARSGSNRRPGSSSICGFRRPLPAVRPLVLPGLVSALTPVPARHLHGDAEALLTAARGNQFVVLPVRSPPAGARSAHAAPARAAATPASSCRRPTASAQRGCCR